MNYFLLLVHNLCLLYLLYLEASNRGGAGGGLGGYSSPSEHASPLLESEEQFYGDFWHL